MNLKPRIKIIVLLTFCILALWNIKAMAASVSVSAPGSVSPNGTFTVKVTGNDAIGKFRVTVTGGSSSTSEVWVEGSTSFSVQAGSSGTVKVSVSPIDVSNSSGAEVTPSGSASVTVSSGSSNSGGSSNNGASAPAANPMITSLGITPYDYDFSNYKVGTATGTTFYASVPNDVTSINIYANTQAGGTISGTGAKNLNEGTNKFTVSNGYYTYYISVNRKTLDGTEPANKDDEEEEEKEDEEEKDAGIGIKTLIIEDYKLEEEFKSEVFDYTVKLEKKIGLDELKEIIQKMTVILNTDNVVYEATPKILENGDGVITILVRDELKEYSIYTITFVSENKEENDGIVGAVIPNNDKSNINGMFGLTNEQQIYIILGAFGITSLMALMFAISSYTQYLRLAEYEDEDEEYEEEDEEQEDLETIEDRNYSEFEKINKYRDSVRQDNEPKKEAKEETKAEPAVSLAEEKEEEKEESNLGRALNFERKLMGFRGLKSERKSGGKHF